MLVKMVLFLILILWGKRFVIKTTIYFFFTFFGNLLLGLLYVYVDSSESLTANWPTLINWFSVFKYAIAVLCQLRWLFWPNMIIYHLLLLFDNSLSSFMSIRCYLSSVTFSSIVYYHFSIILHLCIIHSVS